MIRRDSAATAARGVRYLVRGNVFYPRTEGDLPLVDQVADIATQQSPRLAEDPWARRVIAAQRSRSAAADGRFRAR